MLYSRRLRTIVGSYEQVRNALLSETRGRDEALWQG